MKKIVWIVVSHLFNTFALQFWKAGNFEREKKTAKFMSPSEDKILGTVPED